MYWPQNVDHPPRRSSLGYALWPDQWHGMLHILESILMKGFFWINLSVFHNGGCSSLLPYYNMMSGQDEEKNESMYGRFSMDVTAKEEGCGAVVSECGLFYYCVCVKCSNHEWCVEKTTSGYTHSWPHFARWPGSVSCPGCCGADLTSSQGASGCQTGQ